MGTALYVQTPGHRMNEIDNYETSDKFTAREKVAIRYTDIMMRNPLDADDALWAELHKNFTEPELVALGYYIGFRVGVQRWIITFHPVHGEYFESLRERNYPLPEPPKKVAAS